MNLTSRIKNIFSQLEKQNRAAFIPFVTAGYPQLKDTVNLMHALVDGGADIIELGIPFSDPMADGKVIQRASEIALENGCNLPLVLQMVKDFRLTNQTTPVVLMGYANPIEAMGIANFAKQASEAQVDGVLVVDYPPEEWSDFQPEMQSHGLDVIFLLSPTSTEHRINQVAKLASGYVYYVSLSGVTGASTLNIEQVIQRVEIIRQKVGLPVGVGFGIRDAHSAGEIAKISDAVVIGSKLIEEITSVANSSNMLNHVTSWANSIRAALVR